MKINIIPDMNYREMFENKNITKDKIDPNGQADSFFSGTITNELDLPIYLINSKTYGQIVNVKEVPDNKLNPELTRIMENHDLWEKRYIQEQVRYFPSCSCRVLHPKYLSQFSFQLFYRLMH